MINGRKYMVILPTIFVVTSEIGVKIKPESAKNNKYLYSWWRVLAFFHNKTKHTTYGTELSMKPIPRDLATELYRSPKIERASYLNK